MNYDELLKFTNQEYEYVLKKVKDTKKAGMFVRLLVIIKNLEVIVPIDTNGDTPICITTDDCNTQIVCYTSNKYVPEKYRKYKLINISFMEFVDKYYDNTKYQGLCINTGTEYELILVNQLIDGMKSNQVEMLLYSNLEN